MKSNKRWIERAAKNQEGENDIPEKFRTIHILRDLFGLHGLTDVAVPIESTDWYRIPDVFIKAVIPQIAIDLHGTHPSHNRSWEEDLSTKDSNRREDYESEGIKYIEIYEEETKGYKREEIIKVLNKTLVCKSCQPHLVPGSGGTTCTKSDCHCPQCHKKY